jgi:hypothetical protein
VSTIDVSNVVLTAPLPFLWGFTSSASYTVASQLGNYVETPACGNTISFAVNYRDSNNQLFSTLPAEIVAPPSLGGAFTFGKC